MLPPGEARVGLECCGSRRRLAPVPSLRFTDGTLLIEGLDAAGAALLDGLAVADPRSGGHRARACDYAVLLRRLHGRLDYRDQARAYGELALHEATPLPLRAYQREALAAWEAAKRRGVVVLPTGAGKTYVALRAILAVQRSALVLVPTIDLVQQWALELSTRLGIEVGRYGGGERELREITVSTYDSAVLFMPHRGDRFGLLICDECHHLPAEVTSRAAAQCLAPFRLGLSATPERLDGGHQRLVDLLGPIVHRVEIGALEGNFLASYQVELVEVDMDPDEAVRHAERRQVYRDFLRGRGIDFSRPDGWQQFLTACARDPAGREALAAWREQRRLARASRAKLRALWQILIEHPGERAVVFTDDNETAYRIGADMLLPVLTHHTRPPERREMLARLRDGSWPVLVTSRVLNEGVDVPEVAVGVVVSGSGTVREHVQRLGRLLRPRDGKVAVLYELVSAGTGEGYTSERRRNHAAFGAEPDLFGDGEA